MRNDIYRFPPFYIEFCCTILVSYLEVWDLPHIWFRRRVRVSLYFSNGYSLLIKSLIEIYVLRIKEEILRLSNCSMFRLV